MLFISSADFDLSKAQRGVIFLDGMDKIGSNQNTSEIAQKQVRLFLLSFDYYFIHILPRVVCFALTANFFESGPRATTRK